MNDGARNIAWQESRVMMTPTRMIYRDATVTSKFSILDTNYGSTTALCNCVYYGSVSLFSNLKLITHSILMHAPVIPTIGTKSFLLHKVQIHSDIVPK
jgi:hypothetical protein